MNQEQTIQIAETADGNVETIIVKMDPEKVGEAESRHIVKMKGTAKNIAKVDAVPKEVADNTMEVENGYFERFLVKCK